MSLENYLKDKIISILINGMGVFLLSLYLYAVGNSTVTVFLVSAVWSIIFLIWSGIDYRRRKRYFERLEGLMEELDQPYLIPEFMENSWNLEDQLYREILQKSSKAVIERIYQLESEQKEYREFIEGWIHEVKLPITGIHLAFHNLLSQIMECTNLEFQNIGKESQKRMEAYLIELENVVEQALFYARSDQVYQDFMIKETDLTAVIVKLLKKNKHLLIQNQMNAKVECEKISVYSDGKWLEFILGQVLFNAVKYKKEGSGTISFRAGIMKNGIKLMIRDDGIGISEEEKDKIFEKGFTGSNGRNRGKSTGIGLYLCRKLCTESLPAEAGRFGLLLKQPKVAQPLRYRISFYFFGRL